MTRFPTLVALAAMLALAIAFAACGGGSEDPQAVVDEATLQGIESADMEMTLGMDVKGSKGGHLDVSLSGPFQGEDEAEFPEFDLTATAKGDIGGEKVDFDGGLTLLGDRAYIAYEATEYEVDPSTFTFVRSLLRRQAGIEGKSGEVTACQEAVAELQPSDFVDNLEDGGSADVGGTSATKVSGELDVGGAIGALTELSEDPACSEQLKAAGSLPSMGQLKRAQGEVEQAVKSAHVDIYVGDDHIVRRISAQATIEPSGKGSGGAKSIDLDFDLELTGVNEEQAIVAPSSSKPLSALFVKLGINPLELLGLLREAKGGLGGPGGINELLEGIGSGGFQ